MTKPVPARLHVLLAREAPLGVVIRRGPSKTVCTINWDRRRDEFTVGQWMRPHLRAQGRPVARRQIPDLFCDERPLGRSGKGLVDRHFTSPLPEGDYIPAERRLLEWGTPVRHSGSLLAQRRLRSRNSRGQSRSNPRPPVSAARGIWQMNVLASTIHVSCATAGALSRVGIVPRAGHGGQSTSMSSRSLLRMGGRCASLHMAV